MNNIRLASISDCIAIASIYNYYLGKSTMDLEEKSGGYYEKILDQQGTMEELWVIGLDAIFGWGIIKKYSDREGYKFTGETSVYIHPGELNKGYGRMMKEHLMDRCQNLGYHHLLARIFTENEVSINYNLKMGYTIVGIQKEAGFINGEWKDVTILQYLFQS